MWIAEIPRIIELLPSFSAGEVRKSLRSSGILAMDSGNTTYCRAIEPFFLQLKYGSLSGIAEFQLWNAEIPLIVELLNLFFLQVKYGSLSGIAEFLMWVAEIPLIIELFTPFFCR